MVPDRSRRLARTYRIACYCLQAVCDKNLVFKECQEPYVHTFQWRSVIARAGRAPRPSVVRRPTSRRCVLTAVHSRKPIAILRRPATKDRQARVASRRGNAQARASHRITHQRRDSSQKEDEPSEATWCVQAGCRPQASRSRRISGHSKPAAMVAASTRSLRVVAAAVLHTCA